MSESKHTPGPLELRPSLAGSGTIAMTSKGERIALFYHEPDAKLFVAAPELLEALKLTAALDAHLTEEQCTQDTWRWITQVRAAIAKAEGSAS